MISEACEPGAAVFGGEGVEIHRLALKDFSIYYMSETCNLRGCIQ
ncbi:MAG: hypothetical protein V8R46_09625 [Eubacterium ramulus]